MNKTFYLRWAAPEIIRNSKGFSLIELMIAMVVTAIIGIALVANYQSQSKAFAVVKQVAKMQQNIRGAMFTMEQTIRMAGYDPRESGNFGIVAVTPGLLTIANDDDGDANATLAPTDENGIPDANEFITYQLGDDSNDGLSDLMQVVGGGPPTLLAEGIEQIGFAYAIDNNGDGLLDTIGGANTGPIIWAADTDGDGLLDTNLDTNADGYIDLLDDQNNDYQINAADGGSASLGGVAVPLANIRAVRIWLLARTPYEVDGQNNHGRYYVIGDQVWPKNPPPVGFQDRFRRRVLVRTVQCRNLGA